MSRLDVGWMSEYVDFHASNRLEARRIILHCPGEKDHGGLGDRLRGVMSALQIAAAYNLILAINFTGNFDLTHYLEPARIDWIPVESPGRKYVVIKKEVLWDTNELTEALVNTESDIYVCTIMLPFRFYGANVTRSVEVPRTVALLHCMWSDLFQPTRELQLAHDSALSEIFGTSRSGLEYVAVHFRAGGLVGEGEQHRTKSCNLLAEFAAGRCAHELAHLFIPNSNLSVLYITDNNVLRWAISSNLLRDTVGPRSIAKHTSSTRGLDYTSEYVDLMLLAGATCLVKSASGFSNLALWWGGIACSKSVDSCIKEQAGEGFPSC